MRAWSYGWPCSHHDHWERQIFLLGRSILSHNSCHQAYNVIWSELNRLLRMSGLCIVLSTSSLSLPSSPGVGALPRRTIIKPRSNSASMAHRTRIAATAGQTPRSPAEIQCFNPSFVGYWNNFKASRLERSGRIAMLGPGIDSSIKSRATGWGRSDSECNCRNRWNNSCLMSLWSVEGSLER